MSLTTVIDYGGGNLKSVTNLLDALDAPYKVTNSKKDILDAKRIIFPGQGHFGQAMQTLNYSGLNDVIVESVKSGKPFLGICVGLQLLFESSEEAPGVEGLGLLKGKVLKFQEGKIPQIGWNKVKTTANNSILADDYYYFVNSYYVAPEEKTIISSYCDYNGDFAASIEQDNLIAVQFHPEKSGTVGFETINRWLNSDV